MSLSANLNSLVELLCLFLVFTVFENGTERYHLTDRKYEDGYPVREIPFFSVCVNFHKTFIES